MLEEVLDIAAQWYNLGLQLKVRTGRLYSIWAEFDTPEDQLREMLNAWLTTDDSPSWKTLIKALRSKMEGELSQLAAVLEAKYCPFEKTELDIGGQPETVFPLSVSPAVMLQQTDIQESMSKYN